MSRQPREKWCPYCRESIDQWVSRRTRRQQTQATSKVRYWFLCPHCDQKHPWYQYDWLQFLFVAIGVGSVIAVRGYTQNDWISTGIIGVAIGMALTLMFRIGYTRYMYRDQPAKDE